MVVLWGDGFGISERLVQSMLGVADLNVRMAAFKD
jgi:hypothetical protein